MKENEEGLRGRPGYDQESSNRDSQHYERAEIVILELTAQRTSPSRCALRFSLTLGDSEETTIQARLASMTLTGESVGTTRVRCRPRLAEQLPVFLFRPLLPSRPDEHHHVEHLAWVRRIAGRKHHLDNQEPAARIHRLPTVAQDQEALVFAPIVDDVRENVGIAAAWNTVEEAPASIVTRSDRPRD